MLNVTYKVAVLKDDGTWNPETFTVEGGDVYECDREYDNKRNTLLLGANVQHVLLIQEVCRQGKTLDEQRRKIIEDVWDNYDFEDYGVVVCGCNGWETVQPGDTYRRTFFTENPDGDSIKHTFTVRFQEGTAQIAEASYS